MTITSCRFRRGRARCISGRNDGLYYKQPAKDHEDQSSAKTALERTIFYLVHIARSSFRDALIVKFYVQPIGAWRRRYSQIAQRAAQLLDMISRIGQVPDPQFDTPA